MGLDATNEIVKFIASQTMNTNAGGYINTGGDLIANLVGASVAAMLILRQGGSGLEATARRADFAK